MAVLRMQTGDCGPCLRDPRGSASQGSVCPAGKPQPPEPLPPQLSPSLPPCSLHLISSNHERLFPALQPSHRLHLRTSSSGLQTPPPLGVIPGSGALTHCLPGALLAQPPAPAHVPPLPPEQRGAPVEWRRNGGGWGLCLGTAPFLPSTAPTSRTEGTGLKLREVMSFAKVMWPAGSRLGPSPEASEAKLLPPSLPVLADACGTHPGAPLAHRPPRALTQLLLCSKTVLSIITSLDQEAQRHRG